MIKPQYPYSIILMMIIIFLSAFILGGCSEIEKKNPVNTSSESTVVLPPLDRVLPDDPYLFLPLEHVRFLLTFTEEVDLAVLEESISFEPKVDFRIRSFNRSPEEIYLNLQEKLKSDTLYTLELRNVQNEFTGKTETLKFTYRTEFKGDKQIANPQWSQNGEEIIYMLHPDESDTAELWKKSLKDGNEQLLVSGLSWPGRVSWSPDCKTILYTKMVTQPVERYPVPEVRLLDLDRMKEKVVVSASELGKIVDFGPFNVYSWWSPDGKKIALQLDLGGVDAHSDMIRSMAVVDSDGRDLNRVEGQIFVGWQDDVSLLVLKTHQNFNHSHSYRYDLFLADAYGKEAARLLLGEGQIHNFDRASQSDDFNTIVIGQWKSLDTGKMFKNEGTNLFVYDGTQNTLTPFGLDQGYQKHPAISPVEKEIAFTSNKDGNWNLYLWKNGVIKQLTNDPAHELYPVWSPKGDKIAFVSSRSGSEEIWVLDLSTGIF